MASASTIMLIEDISASLFSTTESHFKEATAKMESVASFSTVGVDVGEDVLESTALRRHSGCKIWESAVKV